MKTPALTPLRSALLLASIWGLCEAVLGYALHLLPFPGLAGQLLFPVGFMVMRRFALRHPGSPQLLLIPVAAALIKLSDLFLPGPFAAVVNPVSAILMQGLASSLFLLRPLGSMRSLAFSDTLILSLAWRSLMILSVLLLFSARPEMGLFARTTPMAFIALPGLADALVIFGLQRLPFFTPALHRTWPFLLEHASASPLLLLALSSQLLLS